MRKPFIAGNWKMNKTVSEAESLVTDIIERLSDVEGVEIGVCPPAIDLVSVREIIKNKGIKLGAQNMHWEEKGAYTGEISGPMLKELGVDYVIIGHSERRQYFGETDQSVNRKVKAVFDYGLKPIICVGETLKERKDGKTEAKVSSQIKAALAGLKPEQVVEVVVAYEPIWAIGTGESATAGQANEVIKGIREIIEKNFPGDAQKVRIQYGGSVKPHNVEEFMVESDIDGALVGGASLEADSFAELIIKTASIYQG